MPIFQLLNFQVILAQMICFLILLFLLKKFLWKPVFNILEIRQKKIDQDFNDLNIAKQDVVKLKDEYQSFLNKTEEIAQKRIKDALAEGELKAQEIRMSAHIEAQTIVAEAKDEIRIEIEKSKDLFKSDVVEMVIKTTERMLQEKLTFENDQKMIEDFLADLDKEK